MLERLADFVLREWRRLVLVTIAVLGALLGYFVGRAR